MENPIVETKTYFNPLKKQFSSEKAAKIGKNEGKYNQLYKRFFAAIPLYLFC